MVLSPSSSLGSARNNAQVGQSDRRYQMDIKKYEEELASMSENRFCLEWERVMRQINPKRKVRKSKKETRFKRSVRGNIKKILNNMSGVEFVEDGSTIYIIKGKEELEITIKQL